MSDPRYDGSADAPFARGSLCVEEGCAQPRAAIVHDDGNDEGHFFNDGSTPLISERSRSNVETVPAVTKRTNTAIVTAAPSARTTIPTSEREEHARRHGDNRTCVRCGQPRGRHRGRYACKFEAPAGETSAAEFVNPTSAQITDAVERALRGMGIAPRIRIRKTTVTPQYAADSDTELLSASVLVELGLIFPRVTR